MKESEKRYLRMYSFENALNIIQNSTEILTYSSIDEVFLLAERIYKYIDRYAE